MRNLNELDTWRVTDPKSLEWSGGWAGDHTCGMFMMTLRGALLRIVASCGDDWDHVSVSNPRRCPTWDEMEHVKRRFFLADEVAMQLHVKPSEHISNHPYTLHLWRPHGVAIPLPPAIMV